MLQLSNATGISRNTLINLEKGSKNVQDKTMIKLENYFESFMLEQELLSVSEKPLKDKYYKGKHKKNVLYLIKT